MGQSRETRDSLSIMDDGHPARPTGNLSRIQGKRLLRPESRGTRNDHLFAGTSEYVLKAVSIFLIWPGPRPRDEARD